MYVVFCSSYRFKNTVYNTVLKICCKTVKNHRLLIVISSATLGWRNTAYGCPGLLFLCLVSFSKLSTTHVSLSLVPAYETAAAASPVTWQPLTTTKSARRFSAIQSSYCRRTTACCQMVSECVCVFLQRQVTIHTHACMCVYERGRISCEVPVYERRDN